MHYIFFNPFIHWWALQRTGGREIFVKAMAGATGDTGMMWQPDISRRPLLVFHLKDTERRDFPELPCRWWTVWRESSPELSKLLLVILLKAVVSMSLPVTLCLFQSPVGGCLRTSQERREEEK